MRSKIAILIDAENISYKDLPPILEEIPLHGDVILRTVYGDWDRPQMQKWQQVAEENHFTIRHQPNPYKTKNSSDYKLMLDAMDVLRWTPVGVFCLVTNDSDYVPLCHTIHESGKAVIGVGYPDASEAFIRACDKFIFIGREELPAVPSIPSSPKSKSSNNSAPKPAVPKITDPLVIRQLLTDAFARAAQDDNGWVGLSAIGMALGQVKAGFQTKTYGHRNLSKLLQSLPDFVELNMKNGVIKSVRLKNYTPPKRPELKNLQQLLVEAFAKAPQNTNGWVDLSALGTALSKIQPDFKTRIYGHSNLSKLLQSLPDFVELQTNDGVKSARLKNEDR